MSNVALVIPVYNEEHGIAASIKAIKNTLLDLRVIFVDDGSTDETALIIKNEIDISNQEFLQLKNNGGYGNACFEGAIYAFDTGAEWVIFIDSDLTNPLEDVLEMKNLIENCSSIEFIKGDRFSDNCGMEFVEFRRKFFTVCARFISRFCFRQFVSDPTNGFRAIKSTIYPKEPPICGDFSSILEELYRISTQKVNVVNFPTKLLNRGSDRRKTSFSYSPRLIWNYFRWCLKSLFRV